MNFRQIFKTEHDLEERLSGRLRGRLKRLLRLYKTRRHLEFSWDRLMRMVSVAWAFMGIVEMGNAAEVRAFPELLHRQEICIDGKPVILLEDEADEGLMWDVACLMLEERSAIQCAYDIAGGYASSLAYDDEVISEETGVVPVVSEVKPKDSSACHVVNGEVPEIPHDVVRWMIKDAHARKNRVYAEHIKDMLTRNVMQRHHPDLFKEIEEMVRACACPATTEVNINAPMNNYGSMTGMVTNNNNKE